MKMAEFRTGHILDTAVEKPNFTSRPCPQKQDMSPSSPLNYGYFDMFYVT